MNHALHHFFGRFELAFEPTEHANTYQIKNYKERALELAILLPTSGIVEFISYNHAFELPSRTLLDVHATIARILHATGLAEQADKIIRDREQTGALARDGSTDIARLLPSALSVLPAQQLGQNRQENQTQSPPEATRRRGSVEKDEKRQIGTWKGYRTLYR